MYYIGIDLGGTNIAVGVLDEKGSILLKKSVPTLKERESSEILNDMGTLVNEVIAEYKLDKKDIHSVGIGSPGIPNSKDGILIYTNNLKFRNTDMRTALKQSTGLDTYIDNDANCAALGESVAGAAAGTASSVTITLGTGVGSGVIIDRKIYSGFNNAASEMGHHTIKFDGVQCNCGRKGCWEQYASATALIRQTIEAAKANPHSTLIEHCKDGNIKKASARTAFNAAKAGDRTGQDVCDTYIQYVAEGIANVVNIFQPELVVIGGGICNEGETLLAPLRKLVSERVYGSVVSEKDLPRPNIVKAKLGNDAGIVGAAMLGKYI